MKRLVSTVLNCEPVKFVNITKLFSLLHKYIVIFKRCSRKR